MRSRLRFWKYPISIMLLLLMIAAFTVVYSLTEKADAPFEPDNTSDTIVEPTPDPTENPNVEDPPDEPLDTPGDEPTPEPEEIYNPTEDGFVTIQMEAADIHRGPLLLVNHNHSFRIPDDIDLVNIVEEKTVNFRVQPENQRLHRSIIEPLDEMMEAFLSVMGMRSVAIRSAYRNIGAQQTILNTYISRMGRREALRWVALPGHSEHHTGLAFDFGIWAGGIMNQFDGTGNTSWFRRNSYRYGFIHRYPRDKEEITKTAHEPWHFRYVGLPHARIMHQNNWALEEYIELLREYTFDEPMQQEIGDTLYEIYFVKGTDIPIPFYSEFEISGNNIDGFIVTIVRVPYDPDVVVESSV